MRSTFQARFSPRGSNLGQIDWGSLFSSGLTTAFDVYKQQQIQEAAEEAKEAAEAQAAAARAAIQASQTAAAEAEQLRTGQPGTILGIPTTYLLLGGAGLAALILVLVLTKK